MLIGRWIAVIAAVAALTASGCSSGGGTHTNSSPRADNHGEEFAKTLQQQYGIRVDSDTAADIADSACSSPTQGVGLYNAQQELAQRHPKINRTNPNAIGVAMSAAVLAYCPERLP